MKRLLQIVVFMFSIISFSVICHAEDGLQIKITNGDYTEEITLTEEFYKKSIEIDYTQDVTVEVVDKEKEVYFSHVVDDQGSVSDIKSETNIFTVTPSEDSEEERIVIRTDEKEYSILYKYNFLLKNLSYISQEGFDYGSRYTILNYGLKTAFSNGTKTYEQGVDNSLDFTTFENEYLGAYDKVVYTGVYCLNEDGTVDTETVQADYPFELRMIKPQPGGETTGTSRELGCKIRIYSISGDVPELIYTQSELGGTNFGIKTDQLGTYAIVYDESVLDADLYYSFDADSIKEKDGVYTIKDLSGNGFDATAENLKIITGYNEIASKSGEAISGSFEIPKEVFSETDSYTMNFWLVNTSSLRPMNYVLDFGEVKLSNAWGSGLCRMCTYIENEQSIYDTPDKGMFFPGELNLYTIVKDNEEIKIYINGFYDKPYFISGSTVDFADIASKEDAQFMVNAYCMIDEMSFYNRAFSYEEVKKLAGIGETTLTIDNASYADNTISVNMSVTDLTESARCIVAAYNEEGNLIGTSFKLISMTKESSYSQTINCPEQPSYIKAFLWNTLRDIQPQCEMVKYDINQ